MVLRNNNNITSKHTFLESCKVDLTKDPFVPKYIVSVDIFIIFKLIRNVLNTFKLSTNNF